MPYRTSSGPTTSPTVDNAVNSSAPATVRRNGLAIVAVRRRTCLAASCVEPVVLGDAAHPEHQVALSIECGLDLAGSSAGASANSGSASIAASTAR